MKTTTITCFAALAIAGHAFAVDRLVPSQYPTIQAAVTAAENGDSVIVSPGTYQESVNLMGKGIDVRSSAYGAAVVVAPSGLRSFLAISNEPASARVTGFTLRASGVSGGGVRLSNSAVIFQNCIFDHCVNPQGGGARVSGGSAVFLGCTFAGCAATGPGGTYGSAGGIHVDNGSTTIDGCTFDSCDGGCAADALLHEVGGSLVVRNSILIGGGSASCFGQIYNAAGSLLVEDCAFRQSNKPAVFAWSPYTVRRCRFEGMTGYAVLDRRNGTYVVDACRFVNCRTSDSLLVYTYSGSYQISGSVVCNCSWSGAMISGPWVDLGGNDFTCRCVGDIYQDGLVNGGDLGIMLSYWGPVTSAAASMASDLNGDGVVNGADLGALLANWGPCPN